MSLDISLSELTTAEKLELMERLWGDLSRHPKTCHRRIGTASCSTSAARRCGKAARRSSRGREPANGCWIATDEDPHPARSGA